ncbi:hypothetical protein TrVE_jg12342 [Triparma verrucosa]|uniref:Uncharacterized protein n=1 Tax=Triparma verrucosa TaxID=1606542 RepID=A0A9W7BG39_9STRA|nr:hypothetical protein TrVE_jg12342 [Triparma verrucosa]
MAFKEELFGYSILGTSSILNDYFIGPVAASIYWILTSTCPVMIALAPCELGPTLFTGVIFWRYVSNALLTTYSLSCLKGDALHEVGLASYVAALVVSLAGLSFFVANLEPEFQLSILFKPVTGKQHVQAVIEDPENWSAGREDKDDEITRWLILHPSYLPMETIYVWVLKLAEKYGLDCGGRRPQWLNRGFRRRVKYIFKHFGNPVWISGVEDAMRIMLQEEVSRRETNVLIKALKSESKSFQGKPASRVVPTGAEA